MARLDRLEDRRDRREDVYDRRINHNVQGGVRKHYGDRGSLQAQRPNRAGGARNGNRAGAYQGSRR